MNEIDEMINKSKVLEVCPACGEQVFKGTLLTQTLLEGDDIICCENCVNDQIMKNRERFDKWLNEEVEKRKKEYFPS